MKFAQIVIGPAGCGKSTYASKMHDHLIDSKRDFCMVNLDPAAEDFLYVPDIDIRELVSLEDVMETDDLKLGPNGGLIFCIEYLIENIGWLLGKLDAIACDYVIFDCPGQIELYTHMSAFQTLFKYLQQIDYTLCVMYMMDSQFMVDPCKFIGGVLSALSSMVMFEVPHINVLTKIDLLDPYMKSRLDDFLCFSSEELLEELSDNVSPKYLRLNKELSQLIDNYSLVSFHVLDYQEEESLEDLLLIIDRATQYEENRDVKEDDTKDEKAITDDIGSLDTL